MALVPHKITALAESDAQGTDGKNIVAGAVVSLYDTNGTAVTLFDNESGANGSTAKQTDATGQVVVYVTAGEYDEEVNGSIKRRVLIGSKELTTLQLIDRVRPAQAGDVITTIGFTSGGDGGAAQWKATAATGLTPSQAPADRGAAELVDGSGRLWELVIDGKVIKPLKLGAAQGGDDAIILNICFSWLRENTTQLADGAGVDGEMKTYNTQTSINATKIVGWNYLIKDITIKASCTGKIALDLIGSRGGCMKNVEIYGNKDQMPSAGIVFTRSSDSGFAFCSHWGISGVSAKGWYSLSAFIAYGQETTIYENCRFWNSNENARAAVFTGSDSDIKITSDYAGVITGETSYINNTYDNIDARYLPEGKIASITNITNSNPAVVTIGNAIPLADGEKVAIGSVKGMSEINNKTYEVANVTSNSFELVGVDSSDFSSYVAAGDAFIPCAKSPVYFARGKDHNFTNLYIVSYGAPNIEFSLNSSTSSIEQINMVTLFEGFGSESHVKFSSVDENKSLVNFNIQTYNTHANKYIFDSDGDSSASDKVIKMYGCNICITSFAYQELNMFRRPALFGLIGGNVHFPAISRVQRPFLNTFSGLLSDEVGEVFRVYSDSEEIIDYTPTVTSQNGTLGAFTVDYYNYRVVGGVLTFSASVTVSDIGTATGAIKLSNPLTPASNAVNTGRETGVSGSTLQCLTTGTDTSARIIGGSFSSGAVLLLSGNYLV